MKNFDILIINKGIVGLALACGLSDYFSILIIEKSNSLHLNIFEMDQWCEQTSLINITSARILQYLKIWNEKIVCSSSLLHKLEVFTNNNNNTKNIIFNSGYLGHLELGYVIDNKLIYQALINRAQQSKNIIFIDLNLLNSIHYDENYVFITLSNNNIFRVKLVIGADGMNSWVRDNANISLIFRDTKYYGLTNIIYTKKKHNNTLRFIIHDDGFLALLPLQKNSHLSAVFWLLPPHMVKKYLYFSMSTQSINGDLIKICNILGDCAVYNDEKNRVSMLRMQYTHNFVNHRLVLLGKAAYIICPLFFQNINLELVDMVVLFNHLKQLKENNQDIGCYDYLKYYERNRKCRITKNFMNFSYIHMLLNNKKNVLKYMQYFIFYLINTVPSLKTRVLHHIMGLDDIPEWLLQNHYD